MLTAFPTNYILNQIICGKRNFLPIIFLSLAACSLTPVAPHTVNVQEANNVGANEYIVQCLLPGKIRKLGSNFTYSSPSSTVETSISDCKIRGGQVSSHI